VADYPPLLPLAAQSKAQQAATAAALQQQQQQRQQQELLQQQAGGVQQQVAAAGSLVQQQQAAAAVRLPPLPRIRDLPWREFFTNKAFLAIVMAHSAFGEGAGVGGGGQHCTCRSAAVVVLDDATTASRTVAQILCVPTTCTNLQGPRHSRLAHPKQAVVLPCPHPSQCYFAARMLHSTPCTSTQCVVPASHHYQYQYCRDSHPPRH